MKICPLCHTTYEDWIDFCFNDGMPLVAKGGAASPLLVRPASASIAPAPRLADEADLPVTGNVRPPPPAAPVGAGDAAPARPAPLEPARDITGVFVGPIHDDDGEEFRRLPAAPMNLASLSSSVPDIEPNEADDATRPLGSGMEGEDADEHSRATVPLTSSALSATEAPDVPVRPAPAFDGPTRLVSPISPASDSASDSPAGQSPAVDAAVPDPSAPSAEAGAESAAPAAPVGLALQEAPTPPQSPAPRPGPVARAPVAEPDEDPPSGGGWGVKLALGGLLALVVVVGGVALAAVMFMGGKEPAAAPALASKPAVVKPVAVSPPPPVPVAPAPIDPVPAPPEAAVPPGALVPGAAVVAAPSASTTTAVVAPPQATPPAPPTASPTTRPTATVSATPVAAKPTTPAATTPVSSKPPATTTPVSNTATADADPWGAPAPSTSGMLKIVTDPDGATVYINETQRGKTPLSVQLPYGTQNIRIVRTGYKTEVRDVTLRVPEISVPFTLKPEVVTGMVNVYGPAGYRVVIDGHDRGAMPVTVQVSEGVRQFKLVSDADGSACSLPREIAFRSPGRPETVTLACP